MTNTPSRYLHTGRKKVDRVCGDCGSVVADTDLHDRAHETILKLAIAMVRMGEVTFDPDPEDVMPHVGGKPFRCSCGANVFKHDKKKDQFKCNGCGETYQGG
jgi:hypothetical protein